MRLTAQDKIGHAIICAALAILGFTTLYPFWNSLVISLNAGSDTALGGITFWPRKFTLDNYEVVFRDPRMMNAVLISVLRTAVGTALSVVCTAIFAYGLSKRGLIGKKFYMIFCIITMYFSGGLIPFFLLCRALGLMNTFWVMVIPGIIGVYHMIIFRTFFRGLPEGLEEAATIDGCSNWGMFFRIVLPISGPVVATLSLFTAVGHWNDWFGPSIFINKSELLPIQTVLKQILNSSTAEQLLEATGGNAAMLDQLSRAQTITTKSLTMATMMVATLPIMMVYPFVQKYFVKGVLVGSLKE